MKITHTRIYGIEEAIAAAALPMDPDLGATFDTTARTMKKFFDQEPMTPEELQIAEKRFKRALTLSGCKGGESHDCFMVGIIVQFNICAPRYWWPEMQRYHFIEIESATSTMHRLAAFVDKCLEYEKNDDWKSRQYFIAQHFSPMTHPMMIDSFLKYAYTWKQKNGQIEELKANLVEGFYQMARVTTNYRQLKTQYIQRNNHPLSQWKEYCSWIKTLPLAAEFILSEDRKNRQ